MRRGLTRYARAVDVQSKMKSTNLRVSLVNDFLLDKNLSLLLLY